MWSTDRRLVHVNTYAYCCFPYGGKNVERKCWDVCVWVGWELMMGLACSAEDLQ